MRGTHGMPALTRYRDAFAKRVQKLGDLVCWQQLSPREIVAPAVIDDAPLGRELTVFRMVYRQLGDFRQQIRFLLAADEVGLILHARRQRRQSKQIPLLQGFPPFVSNASGIAAAAAITITPKNAQPTA